MPVQFQSATLATPSTSVDIASETIGGIDYQQVKLVWGSTGTATTLTTSAGLPVQVTGQSSALNVTTTPSSQATVSVTPTTQFSVTTTPSSQVTVSVTPTTQFTVTTTPSTTLSVAQSTTPWLMAISTSTGAVPIIGAVQPSTQWTVSTIPTSQITASVTPTSQFTVTTTPSSQITASVTPTTQFTVTTIPSSQVTVTAITTAIRSFAGEQTVIMSSGVAQTVLYKPFAASATGLTVVTTAVASKIQVLIAVQASCGTSVCQISWRNGTSSTTLIPPGLIGGANGTSIVLPWNPVGWVESLSGEGLTVNIASTGTPAVGGCIVYAAI